MRLIVIAGPANSGKMPLARKLIDDNPGLVLVHRDSIRDAIVTPIDEWEITLLMRDVAARLLQRHDVVICAWNLEPADGALWRGLEAETGAELEWLDTRDPAVQRMIPPIAA